jgi:putative autotransporter adhesin-like protein
MNTRSIIVILILFIAVIGCDESIEPITGSGNYVVLPQDLKDFAAVNASHGFRVDLTPSDSFAVIITMDDNLVDRLQARVNIGRLELGLIPNTSTSNAMLQADVSMPFPTSLTGSGGSRFFIGSGYDGAYISYNLSGGSRVEGSILATASLFLLSGGSTAVLQGQGESAAISCFGGSTASLFEYPLMRCSVDASGGSTVQVSVSDTLDVVASGGSTVLYKGNPELGEVNLSGGSKLERIP